MAKFSINQIEGNNNVIGDKNVIINHSPNALPKTQDVMLDEDIEITCKILSLLPDRSKTSTKALINLKLPDLLVSSEEVRVAVEILVENGLAFHEKPKGKFDEIWLTSKGRQVKSLPDGFRGFYRDNGLNQIAQTFQAIQNTDRLMNKINDRIFLCHASEDRQAVIEIYHKLRSNKLNPWLDKMDLLPGQRWQQEIPKVLKKSRFILVFFSSNSVLKRGYVQREFKLALDTFEEIPEGQIFIIPVRLNECEILESFSHLHHVDLFEEEGFDKVKMSIDFELAKDSKIVEGQFPQPLDGKRNHSEGTLEGPYYAAPAQFPHQKGKWAVFLNDAQLVGTLRETEEEARANAEGMNKTK